MQVDSATEMRARPLVPVTRILVVDDDQAMRSLLTDAFLAEGYDVVTAGDGDVALSVLFEDLRGADVVVTDQRMPNLSGLELAERLRRTPGWTPVVIVSAFADADLEERARKFGVSRVFPKPFSVPDLLDVVRQLAPIGA